ncbi:hypothetical protein LDO31_16670 [Luteimonas sp. XNQY3]|nr:hypothetical protein [Luteimonas sp. XNQY3]MCD9007835.1 hypothetical protein [Luteimonas sp. XNQY3]
MQPSCDDGHVRRATRAHPESQILRSTIQNLGIASLIRRYGDALLTATARVRLLLDGLCVRFDALAVARVERCRDRHVD